ncbi:MAG: arginine--tRNA ligase [bacterium]
MDLFADSIAELLTQSLRDAGLDDPPPIAGRMVERPPDAELGDYAFPCFMLAKTMRKAPPAIAQQLAGALADAVRASELLSAVEAAGPYLNFRVSAAAMAAHTIPGVLDGSYFGGARAAVGKKTMVEYSQPNTHKAFHVGHMRNVALGDALVRILRFAGHQVVAANYIGDSGAHIAKCIWYYLNHRAGEPPKHNRGEWLGTLYVEAEAKLVAATPEQRAGYDAEIAEVLRVLERANRETGEEGTQARDTEVFQTFVQTRRWSMEAFEQIYEWVGAEFDHVFSEAEMDRYARDVVDAGLAKGVFVRSEGAVGIELEPHKLGFLLVLKGDGNTLYATKDLALAEIKFRDFGIEESIYVVGAEQTLHFRQVFKTLELLGYPQAAACHHLPYGLVMLPKGKMSSRAGKVILFSQLRRELNAYIEAHYMGAHRGDWDEREIEETTRRVAVAAIRYGMVKQDPAKSIVFNLEDWLQSEGDTGTYLCYAYTRIMSVLARVAAKPDPTADFALLAHPHERMLLRELYDFNRVVQLAARGLRPNLLAGALFQIAKEFSRTYRTCSVLHAETPQLAAARLALFAATGRVLHQGLALLGITPPERM